VVITSAMLLLILYIPASSGKPVPERILGSVNSGKHSRTLESSEAENFDAHPEHDAIVVILTLSRVSLIL
jgi:hypothetical protein